MCQRRWIELFSDYECEMRYHPGKVNVVADALSRKERVKPRHVRAMAMTIQSETRQKMLETRLDLSAALHPQVDGQSERMIQTLEDIMRACVSDFVDSYHMSIWCAPFKALDGRKCRSHVLWTKIRRLV
nr:reverse transcriptase domain-containing protein [Tanacetum cinerariifolium]